jgi:DNA-binding NtrC family response regulator
MNLKNLNILLAEDDIDDCTFFKKALAEISSASHLTILHDGEKLMHYLNENSDHLPLVLFLDINMPLKNGAECLSEIRQDDKLKDLPVVMFSTTNAWDTIDKLFKCGAHVYIHKPSDFGQLKQVIHHAIPLAAERIFSTNPVKYILNASDGRPRR